MLNPFEVCGVPPPRQARHILYVKRAVAERSNEGTKRGNEQRRGAVIKQNVHAACR